MIDLMSGMACTYCIMACYAAFVAALGQGKTTAAQSLLWELEKTLQAINHLSVAMQSAVRICCQEGLVWRYVVVCLKVSRLDMHKKANQVWCPKRSFQMLGKSFVLFGHREHVCCCSQVPCTDKLHMPAFHRSGSLLKALFM